MTVAGRLEGERALVTGSTAGLGAEIARVFAAEGAAVVLTGRDSERGATIRERINADGGTAHFAPAELSDPAACRALVDTAADMLGSLTVLVNNAVAGTEFADGPVTAVAPSDWEGILRVDLLAAAWLTAASLPHMSAAGRGAIVNISSRAANRPSPGHAAYVTAKGGLAALTRAVAVEAARDGIRCNTVTPGYILHERRDANLEPERRERLEAMQLTRLTTAHDVALACAFLASQEAACITGTELPVDGGSSIARAQVIG